MLLGQARGSVGDLTFYCANGQQVTRSRNRHPRNPKTNAQLVQRAITATILRAYSLGKSIFDHSFEGVGVGMPSMRRFLSQNMKLMRTSIVNALNSGTVSPYRVAAPGVNIPIANAYVVSTGTLLQTFFTLDNGDYKIPAIGSATTVAEYVAANMLQEGDIFTFLGFFAKPTDPEIEYVDPEEGFIEGMSIAYCYFGYVQLRVKAGAAEDLTEVTADTDLGAIFDIVEKTMTSGAIMDTKLGGTITIGDMADNPDYGGAWGVIMSREASGLRSNCTLRVIFRDQLYGITSPYLIRAWRTEGSYADPSLILDGSNFNPNFVPGLTVDSIVSYQNTNETSDSYLINIGFARMSSGQDKLAAWLVPDGNNGFTVYGVGDNRNPQSETPGTVSVREIGSLDANGVFSAGESTPTTWAPVTTITTQELTIENRNQLYIVDTLENAPSSEIVQAWVVANGGWPWPANPWIE